MNPIKLLTTDSELRRVVDQINSQIVAEYNTNISDINSQIAVLSVSGDSQAQKIVVSEVTDDYDIVYTDDGEIVTEE